MCSHHELQRRKTGLDGEIRQLEAEGEKIIRAKEQELTERLARERPNLSQAQVFVTQMRFCFTVTVRTFCFRSD